MTWPVRDVRAVEEQEIGIERAVKLGVRGGVRHDDDDIATHFTSNVVLRILQVEAAKTNDSYLAWILYSLWYTHVSTL